MDFKARLILEDGAVFEGKAAGFPKSVSGEVVFATGMTGYDLSLTDPSYTAHILTFTYPLIGNWGVPREEFWESGKIQVSGVVISDLTAAPSHYLMQKTLNDCLIEEKIPAIVGVDTRALTQKLREKGVMLGKIVIDDKDIAVDDPNTRNLVAEVSTKKVIIHKPLSGWRLWKESRPHFASLRGAKQHYTVTTGGLARRSSAMQSVGGKETTDRTRAKIALLNCGAKRNIARSLTARGATIYELPWNYDPFGNNLKIDGLVISNGPGNPKMAKESIAIIKKALDRKIPTFGICLGNQLLALAAGGNTYKLKFGHRAQNQPTIEVNSQRCYITTQNHGFAVDEKKLPSGFKRWFYNANDNTNEGITHVKLPFLGVQFHPEAAPGPTDTNWLFDYFLERVTSDK